MNTQTITLKELTAKVEDAIQDVLNGLPSRYVRFYHPKTDEHTTIRVSNHMANPSRLDADMLSLVIPIGGGNYKQFANVPDQYWLSEEGTFVENFYDVADFLDNTIF